MGEDQGNLTLAKVSRRPMRDVWRYEDAHFTRWLVDNIDAVGEAIGLELSNAQREIAAGSFRLDLLAEDSDGNPVIIENQFGRSDHDHLGKLLTYRSVLQANTAIWIVETARPEHVSAISWLNESTSGSFYLLKVEAISIGDSAAGPLLTLVVGPSEESEGVGDLKREWAERHHLRHAFWRELLEHANNVLSLHAGRSPGNSTYLIAPSRWQGLSFAYGVRRHGTHVELYIDKGDSAENLEVFSALFGAKQRVEQAFGGLLSWEEMPERRGCRLAHRMNSGGYRDDKEAWPRIIEEMVGAMDRLSKALEPELLGMQASRR